MTLEDDFMWVTGDAFSEMRILVEGALVLFESDTSPLIRLCADANEHAARTALNDIGGALYDLRRLIKRLQEAYWKENERLNGKAGSA